VPGHWEGDLVFGTRSSAIATLVERQSRFVLLVSPPHRHTASVVAQALAGAIVTLPAQLRRSLTWDQDKEMAEHARFSVATASRSTSATRPRLSARLEDQIVYDAMTSATMATKAAGAVAHAATVVRVSRPGPLEAP